MNINNACPICHGEGCHVSFAGKPCPRSSQVEFFANREQVSEVQGLVLKASVENVFNERIERLKEVNELRRLFELPNGSKKKWHEGLKGFAQKGGQLTDFLCRKPTFCADAVSVPAMSVSMPENLLWGFSCPQITNSPRGTSGKTSALVGRLGTIGGAL